MAKFPLVVTFGEDKHDTSSTFICNNVEEYKKVKKIAKKGVCLIDD